MRLSNELRASLEAMASGYQRALSEGARNYLTSRGLGPEAVTAYRLGQVDALHAEHAQYAGMLSIPYLSRAGVVSLKFRQLAGHSMGAGKKYINPGYQTRLFNTPAMDVSDRTGVIGIAEGEIDAIILTHYCGIPAVGIPGAENWKAHPEWRELFRGYPKVLIFQDNDEPNATTGLRPGEELSKQIIRDIEQAQVVRLPAHDVNDTYLAGGRDAIRKAAGL